MADDLSHAYDAAKRREYYLRTRKLKGRRHGSAKPPVKPKKTRAQRQAERHRQLEAKVNALKARLEKLRAVLEAETKKAKARSGVKQPTKKSTPASSSKKTSNSKTPKLTPTQKAKKAKEEKKRREQDPDLQLAEQVKSLNEKIKTIHERINKMRKSNTQASSTAKTK